MVEQQQHPPTLKLLFLKGPLKDETLQFPPGSTIKIGRVIRGNTLPIKDPGISTKHLSISIESNQWTLRDLHSSNGTVLDDTNVPPNTPFHLSDGATIKIGETTSFLVNFLHPQNNSTSAVFEDKPVRGRRPIINTKGFKARVPVHSIDENSTFNAGDESSYVVRPESVRVTRNSKNARSGVKVSDSIVGNLNVLEEKVEEPKNTRAKRNLKNKQKVVEVSESSIGDLDYLKENVEESKNKNNVVHISESSYGDLDGLKEKVEEQKNVVEISELSIRDLDGLKEKVEEPVNTRVTRNARKKGKVIIGENSVLVDEVQNLEKKKTRGGAKGRKKVQEECVGDGDAGDKESCDDGKEKENLNLNVDRDENENWPDLEKMTLAEWFDFLEVYLPKQIIDETEEMFASMRQKAERLREYVTMHQSQKLEAEALV